MLTCTPCHSRAAVVRVPASCVPYVPTARGSSRRVPTYGYGSSTARAPEPDAPCVPHAYLGTPALHHGWSFGGAARTAPAAARESSRPRTAPPRPPQQHRRPPSRPATPVAQMDARGMPGVTSVEYWDTLTPTLTLTLTPTLTPTLPLTRWSTGTRWGRGGTTRSTTASRRTAVASCRRRSKSIVQHSAAQCSIVHHSAAQCSIVHHSAAQHSIVQHSAA